MKTGVAPALRYGTANVEASNATVPAVRRLSCTYGRTMKGCSAFSVSGVSFTDGSMRDCSARPSLLDVLVGATITIDGEGKIIAEQCVTCPDRLSSAIFFSVT
jgi:hypothetical protein